MTNYSKLLIVLTFIIFNSCKPEKKEPTPKSDWEIYSEKKDVLDSLNLSEAEKLIELSNASAGWDTIGRYTYSLQETFENVQKPISFIGRIKDIIKKDSLYVLKIVKTNSRYSENYIAEISVGRNMFNLLKSNLLAKKSDKGCFIFYVTKVKSSIPILHSEIESSGEFVEDASSYLTLDFDESIIKLEGNLLTYFIYNNLKEENE
jgi:hypothetical protein